MNISEYVSGNWLTPALIKELKIRSVVVAGEFVINEDTPFGRPVCEGEVEVQGKRYILTINKTSANAISEAYGSESKNWIGKTLRLALQRQNVKGQFKDVLYCAPDSAESAADEPT